VCAPVAGKRTGGAERCTSVKAVEHPEGIVPGLAGADHKHSHALSEQFAVAGAWLSRRSRFGSESDA
jgi:hypothetical protein